MSVKRMHTPCSCPNIERNERKDKKYLYVAPESNTAHGKNLITVVS